LSELADYEIHGHCNVPDSNKTPSWLRGWQTKESIQVASEGRRHHSATAYPGIGKLRVRWKLYVTWEDPFEQSDYRKTKGTAMFLANTAKHQAGYVGQEAKDIGVAPRRESIVHDVFISRNWNR
jgi:hypothetical protein